MKKNLSLIMLTTLGAIIAAVVLPNSLYFFAAYVLTLLIIFAIFTFFTLFFKRKESNEYNNEKNHKVANFFIILLAGAFVLFFTPFFYSEIDLISSKYTKIGDISKIIAVNNDSDYEVLRTVKNKNGEDMQIVVAKDLGEFTALVNAEYDGNHAVFTLSDGHKCYMKHEYKSTAFCGKLYNYNIFTFQGCTIQDLLADDNRSCD